MDFPGLDVKKLTDDELLRKVSELHGKLVYAYNYGMASEMISQLQALLETLEFEQHDRLSKRMFDVQQRKAKAVIETDPDLVEKKEVETTKTKVRTSIGGGSGLLKRSKTPSSDKS